MITKVLILDDVGNDAVYDTLRAASVDYFKKYLNTNPTNWATIIERMDSEGVDAVVGSFSETALYRCSGSEYDELFEALVERLSRIDHMLLVFETNLDGQFTWYSDQEENDGAEDSSEGVLFDSGGDRWLVTADDARRMRERLATMVSRGLNIVPYRKRAEKTLTAQAFLESVLGGMLLRMYVPNDRAFSHEIERFISLFTSYAQKVLRVDLAVQQHRTAQGAIYTFHSTSRSTTLGDLNQLNEQFTTFLDLCANDLAKAEELIVAAGVLPREAPQVLQRYAIEVRRLRLDIRHEHERRLQAIRQRLESELQDVATAEEIAAFVASVRPSHVLPSLQALASTQISIGVLNVVNPQIVGQVQGIVASELSGNVDYNEKDQQLLAAIERLADELETVELTSALDILKDRSADRQERATSWQKLRQFLARRGEKLEDTTLKVLQEYLSALLKASIMPS